MPVLIDLNCAIGASGAPSSLKGPYVSSISRLSAGIYKIKLQDNYSKLYSMMSGFQAPVSGSAIDPNAGVVGTVYQITAVGNSNWSTAGVSSGVTPAVGVAFKLAAAPAAGTGLVKAIGSAGIDSVELVGNSNLTLAPAPSSGNSGGEVIVKCMANGVATDPADGSVMQISLYVSNSSITLQGE